MGLTFRLKKLRDRRGRTPIQRVREEDPLTTAVSPDNLERRVSSGKTDEICSQWRMSAAAAHAHRRGWFKDLWWLFYA